MKTKYLTVTGLLFIVLCGLSANAPALPLSAPAKKNLVQPTATPKPSVAGLSSGQKKKLTQAPTSSQSKLSGLSTSQKKKLSAAPSSSHTGISGLSSEQKKKLAGVDTTPKSKLPGLSSEQKKKVATMPVGSVPSGNPPPGSPPKTGGPSNQSPSYPDKEHHIWVDQIVIDPIVLPYPQAVVEVAPGQVVLPAGYTIPRHAREIALETRQSNRRGSLSVATLWNGQCGNDSASRIKMNIEARECLPNHNYGVAIFSGDADWAKAPQKIGALKTNGNGAGYQEFEYVCGGCPPLDFAVGLYELQGNDLIAGPMSYVWAGQIGAPNCSR